MTRPWFLWSLMAVLCWGLWAVLSKLTGDALTPAQAQAASTIGLLPVLISLGFSKRLAVTGQRSLGLVCAIAAGLLACAGNTAYYHALNSGAKATTVVPLTALYPLLTIVLAVIFLHEKLNRIQLGGVVCSLLAIYLFNISSISGVETNVLGYALVPILFWGVAGFLQKISTNHLSGESCTLWFLAAFIPVGGLILYAQPISSSTPIKVWISAAALGLFFAMGNLALLEACARGGKASIVVPFTALYPVISIPIAMIAFRERIAIREAFGIIFAVISVFLLSQERDVSGRKESDSSTIQSTSTSADRPHDPAK